MKTEKKRFYLRDAPKISGRDFLAFSVCQNAKKERDPWVTLKQSASNCK